jgi:hypothetical protein
VDNRSTEAEKAAIVRVEAIKRAWRDHEAKIKVTDVDAKPEVITARDTSMAVKLQPRHTSLIRQITVLTGRTWIVTLRDPMGMIASLVEAIAMGIIMGWIFLQVDGSLSGIRSRQGALYTAAVLQGYLILLYETYRLTTDIQLFDEEARQGVVGIPAFLISRRLARLVIEDVPVPLIFSLIFYFMTGFRTNGEEFMIFFAVILLEQYIAVCFATLCVAVSRNFAEVNILGLLVMVITDK